MKCERCEGEVPEDAFFCPECGTRVGYAYDGMESSHIEKMPVLHLDYEHDMVTMPTLPDQPKLHWLVVLAITVIGMAAAVALIIVVGWILLPNFLGL